MRTERPVMLGLVLIVAAIVLRLSAGINYFIATYRGRVRPNPVTWLFWGLAPLIAFLAQVQNGITPASWVTLALSIGPLAIFIATIRAKVRHWKIGPFDIACGALASAGIILWQITSDPVVALVFGICADIAGGIPTIIKAYHVPRSETAIPYAMSAVSMVLTICTVQDWEFMHYGFPVYIFCINTLIYTLIATGRFRQRRKK